MKDRSAQGEKHEFALFIESLSSTIKGKGPGSSVIFSDEKLLHRMINVLRLHTEDSCIFFDRHVQVNGIITNFMNKKQVAITVLVIKPHVELQPDITFLLPVLKRDDYESALYALAELGVNTIQLVFTRKSVHQWAGQRDYERAQKILISAAEQSKNFVFPELNEPISFGDALKKYHTASVKIFFDPYGEKFFDTMQKLHASIIQNGVVLLVGPEGDLHEEEKTMVSEYNFMFCALTPTIIRAVQAAALGAGFVRSLLVSTTR
jgi:16S rRNA (uracil1498-N3)-methyltransferase